MPLARILFTRMVQHEQVHGDVDANRDHMESTLYFTMEIDGHRYEDMKVDVSHPFGTRMQQGQLEVGKPVGSYKGPFNHARFANEVDKCVRRCIGSEGASLSLGDSESTSMQGNVFEINQECKIEIPALGPAW